MPARDDILLTDECPLGLARTNERKKESRRQRRKTTDKTNGREQKDKGQQTSQSDLRSGSRWEEGMEQKGSTEDISRKHLAFL